MKFAYFALMRVNCRAFPAGGPEPTTRLLVGDEASGTGLY
jgi:hypothetical protein